MFAVIKTHAWAYPALEVAHIVGIALLLGNLVLMELRVLGFGRALPVVELARLSLVVVCCGFALAAVSGLLMFATQPEELLTNRAFTLKLVLLMLAALNAAWFHVRRSLVRMDALARGQMAVSTVLWIGAIACGRFIAYL